MPPHPTQPTSAAPDPDSAALRTGSSAGSGGAPERADGGAAKPAPGAAKRTRMSPAERRASILTAATEAFARSGYQRTKVSDIAGAVGVTEPVVFQNFGSKAALYEAVVLHAGELAQDHLTQLARGGGAAQLLKTLLSPEHMHEQHTGGHLGAVFADAMTLSADPRLARAAGQAVAAMAAALARFIEHGREAGDIDPQVDPEAAAWSVLSLLASHGFRRTVMPDHARLEHRVTATFLAGILARDA